MNSGLFSLAFYFVISSPTKIIPSTNVVLLNVDSNLVGDKDRNFVVRPNGGGNSVSIFDQDKGKWVSGSDIWTNMPILDKELKLKFRSPESDKLDLSLQLQDTKTAEIYSSNELNLWTRGAYGNYVSNLNQNLKKYHRKITTKQERGKLTKMIEYISELFD